MQPTKLIICTVFSTTLTTILCEPFTIFGILAGAAALLYNYHTTICRVIGLCEGCEDYWIPGNLESLESDLKSDVFGQTLAVNIVLDALKQHLRRGWQPQRALMMSFHGAPGTGKNFVSQKIINNMFRNKHHTSFVKWFRGSIDFPSSTKIEHYKNMVKEEVKKKVYECHRSVFVFDEVDKIPQGILGVLRHFMEVGKEGDFDYRRVIFILLSNIGTGVITKEALKMLENYTSREEVDEDRFKDLLAAEAFGAKGGLQNSGLVKDKSITHYVPFLPLEKDHVVQCLAREVEKSNQIMSTELTELVLDELTFGPKPSNAFAHGGCKNVGEKAAILFQKMIRRKRKQSNY